MSGSLKKYTKHESYPWRIEGVELFPAQTMLGKERLNMIKGTGEVITLREISSAAEKMIDQRPFIKLYAEGVEKMAKISKRGSAVLCYMLKHMAPGSVAIVMDYKEVVAEHPNLKGDGFYIGLRELLDYGIIARKKSPLPVFFININCFFNGDRRRVIPKKKPKTDNE